MGNGKIDATENCDDGNTANGDGCSSTGTIEANYVCDQEPSVCVSIGDGKIEAPE